MRQRLRFLAWPTVFFLVIHFLAMVLVWQTKETLLLWPGISPWHFLVFCFLATFLLLIPLKIIKIPNGDLVLKIPRPLQKIFKVLRVFLRRVIAMFKKRVSGFKVWAHDLIMIFFVVFLAWDFGAIFLPREALIVLGVMTIYDIFAVFKSKHMVGLTQALLDIYLIPGFIFPKINSADFNADLSQVVQDFNGTKPERFSILGGGDIVIPAMLVVSVFLCCGLAAALIILGFALLGLWLMYVFFLLLGDRPFPALFCIGPCSIVGYMISDKLFF